jgi:Domain of unknown function (DUF3841)
LGIYWTMQTIEAWEQAVKQGFLVGDKDLAMFPESYQWMMRQMKQKLPEYQGEYPVWLWVKKPDMRSTGHFSGGTKCVRLKLELNDKDVLISDFEDWHFVLNNWFCSDNEEEDRNFEQGILSISKEDSWQRIFDQRRVRDPEWHGTCERLLQGVTGQIELSAVKKVEQFVTRRSQFDE